MGIETATYFDALVTNWPTSRDQLLSADDHCRLIRSVWQRTFSKTNSVVSACAGDLNVLVGAAAFGIGVAELSNIRDLTASVQAQLDLKAIKSPSGDGNPYGHSHNMSIRTISGSSTLTLTDAFNALELDGAVPIGIIIPTVASVAFERGTEINIFKNTSSDTASAAVAPLAGVTLLSVNGDRKLGSGVGGVSILKMAYNDVWGLSGDLTPA